MTATPDPNAIRRDRKADQAAWTTLDEKMSINQDAVVIPIIWQGQLVCSNRSLQGILIDAA
jgi:hypothetical protein